MLFFAALPAEASWITFQNDTKQAMIVQELVTVRGKVVPGRPVKLAPGETLREFQPSLGAKTIQILEPGKAANKLLHQSDVAVKDKDLSLSIAVVKGQVKLIVVDAKKK
jgi:hypothetical protein